MTAATNANACACFLILPNSTSNTFVQVAPELERKGGRGELTKAEPFRPELPNFLTGISVIALFFFPFENKRAEYTLEGSTLGVRVHLL